MSECSARCLGVDGHVGPHQTVDGRPLLFDTPEAVGQVQKAIARMDGVSVAEVSGEWVTGFLAALRKTP